MPTHHLAAIMFTDIVGYTAMMQQDRAKGMTAVKMHEDILEERLKYHGGDLIQTMGDGSLSMFQSASAAIQCAKEIQEHLHGKVPLRIGLHVGEITREGKHTFGDGVNITSRIESMGMAGAVLFSKEMYDKIRNRPEFEVESLGIFDFKNVNEPMEVFALANEGFPIPKPEEMKGKGKHLGTKGKLSDSKLLIRGALIGFVGIMLGVGLWFSLGYNKNTISPQENDDKLKSIAVLSFENLSTGSQTHEENEFFCRGITEDIRTHLTKLKAIKVAGKEFSAENDELLGEAKEQAIEYILKGNVRRIDDDVRVTATLIHTTSEEQIWANNYDRELTGIFEIQSDIAKSIASALQLQLSPKEEEALSPFGTENLEAYKLYLKSFSMKFDDIDERRYGNHRTIDTLEKVIQLDSTFAAAHATLGERYFEQASWYGDQKTSMAEAYTKAIEQFKIAQRLNPYEEAAYRRMVMLNMHYEWDFETAKENIDKSAELAPNSPGPWDYYQWIYTLQGKYTESISYGAKVLADRQYYAWGEAHYGLTLYLDGQEKNALQILEDLVQREPQYASGLWRLAQVYLGQDSAYKAIGFINGLLQQTELRPAPILATLGGSYARIGDWEKANMLIEELEKRHIGGEAGLNFFIAMIYAGGKDEAKTLEWLEKSYQAHDWEIVWLKAYPVFRFLHGHPTYESLLEKINLG